ncbi:MAG: transglutaminase-like domain-containing protein, partial [Oscillospiraceae bacterium]|nr:transglutaminase-like domain-containing protein [Oscillospiraceae bacterium]
GCDRSGTEIISDSSSGSPDTDRSSTPVTDVVAPDNPVQGYGATVSVADIKNAYGSSEDGIMPLYNVEPDETFEFKFKSNWYDSYTDVEPIDMVTVHTDPACTEQSRLYTGNLFDGEDGTRLTVAPIGGVLTTDSEEYGAIEDDVEVWGNAAMYYIALWCDTEAEGFTKLDKPVVIPFTVKHELGIPTVKGVVDSTGRFKLIWDAVDGATSYNIYWFGNTDLHRTGEINDPVAGADSAFDVNGECHLLKDSSTAETEFDNFSGKGHGLAVHENSITGEEYVLGQNYNVNGSYFVTAVFGDKESGLSNIVNTADLILPYRPIDEDDIMMERFDDETKLPKTMRILNIDGSVSERNIIYSFKWGNSYLMFDEDIDIDTRIPQYQYEVEGTAISGYVTMSQENRMEIYKDKAEGEAPTGHINTNNNTSTKSDPENNTPFNPEADVPTIIEDEPPQDSENRTLVERQTENTEKHIANGNSATVENTEYPVFADSAEEEWLARNLIAGSTEISLEAFPRLQAYEELADVFQKVYYQNPYVLGITSYMYDYATLTLNVKYCYTGDEIAQRQSELFSESNNIIAGTVNGGMSDEDKCLALYNYFNANTVYDTAAVEEAEKNNFTKSEGWKDAEDAFNAYGIIVKKTGVCQSYALSYKLLCHMCGIEAKVITGYLNDTLPHAWNAVKLGGEWYQTDCTNNETNCGIPFFLYEAGEDDLAMTGYTEDKFYELDLAVGQYSVTDSDREYYKLNDLCASSMDEYKVILSSCLEDAPEVIAIRYAGGRISQDDVVRAVVEVYNMKGMEDKLANLGLGLTNGFILLINR